MIRKVVFSGLAAGALAISGLATGLPGATAAPTGASHTVRVCTTHVAPGHATCYAEAVASANGKIRVSAKPFAAAFSPSDIQSAYKLTGLHSNGRTVAIVDAYGYSRLASDLATYRSNYGLPPCTVASGCLKIRDQNGGTNYPPNNSGWDLEQALDVDAVSAACPDCKILMVQANSPTFANLGTAVNTAAAQPGVVAISNSYGGGDSTNKSYYNHKNIAITASTGDSGNQGGSYPADDTHVVAVGGTSLYRGGGGSRGFHETAWNGAGSGCSNYNSAPKYQHTVNTSCGSKDATADVSAAADPGNGGLNIYGPNGWEQVGGTSESSPLIAAVYALSGNTAGYPGRYPYQNTSHLFDVTSGSNGSCGSPLCTAGPGWDGPTGLGTPNGASAF
ncbi:MAG: hypothetical protein ACR2KG_01520 [Nocardioidaceae bacterium]